MPEISVIVPVFDMEKYLRQCVQSVLAQTFHDWELILVDDGSTDASGSICDEAGVSDARIRSFHIPNGGPAKARNFGLDQAQGEHIAFVDADDLLHPQALEILLHTAVDNAIPLVCGEIKNVRENFHLSDAETDGNGAQSNRSRWQKLEGIEAVKRLLYQRGLDTSVYGKLYHRSLFYKERFTSGIIYEDLDILYRLVLSAGEIAAVRETVYYHRFNPESLLHRFSSSRLDVLRVTHSIEGYANKQYPALVNAARARRLAANFNIMCEAFVASSKSSDPKDKELTALKTECWEVIRQLRGGCLADPCLRLKDRIGIAASYIGGKRFIEFLAGFLY